MLSAVAHGNGPNGPAVVQAALFALDRLDREHAAVYFQILWNGLRAPMQRALGAKVIERQTSSTSVLFTSPIERSLMSTCARCAASPADFFNTNGDTLCRICFSAQQQQAADGRATASLADAGVAGVRYSAEPTSSNGAIGAGLALIGVGVGLGGALLWFTGTLYFWFIFLAGAGFVSLARGLMLRRRR